MKAILEKLFNHEVLTRGEAKELLINISQEKYKDSQIAALLTVYRMRDITVDEIVGYREALMQSQNPLDFSAFKPIDIVGTGGDGKNTFNISTCSCFVVAGAGYKVAKHGNYGATSVSGASNVIELHGVKFTSDHSQLTRSIEECGMAYMHAPFFTPAMMAVGPVRKSLQFKTIFNLLGPLVNPCRPQNQLLGTADLTQMRLYTNVYQTLDINYGVVNSLDGYDEISLTGDFKVATNSTEKIYTPESYNFKRVQMNEIFGGQTAEEAKAIFDNVLMDKATEAQKNVVIANAGFAIHIINQQKSVEDCMAEARESIESGRALATLKKFVELNS
ncbi:MAG: anthranilate phosphoribosyltransferase [Salinivirgaceae bacterium]|jgi:anthranilate phosphoribosyltransferase|nr:anthranilate phosphoribosyltransferase [Salinivirgaceae bacterium]MBR2196820.1 anthranilate phosphoribosyltransferase [Salinivirgaceae bacterium]MBR3567317.1 anthranilate phosphoribosyltransferase [Salinivirgaceae bacterium]